MTDFQAEPGPLLVPRKTAFAMLGVGATMGHQLINAGRLDARKLGEKTLISMASIRALADGLPRAMKRDSVPGSE